MDSKLQFYDRIEWRTGERKINPDKEWKIEYGQNKWITISAEIKLEGRKRWKKSENSGIAKKYRSRTEFAKEI